MKVFWGKNCDDMNTELCFVLRVQKHRDAVLRIIAKDVYNIFINGIFVHYGPARAAKGYARIDELNLGKYLTQEDNLITVYVQSLNTYTLCFAKEKPLFGAELYISGELRYDATHFDCYRMTDRLVRVERMSCQRNFLEIYRMDAPREPFHFFHFPKVDKIACNTPVLLERNVGYSRNEEVFANLYETGGVSIDETRFWRNDFTDLLDGTLPHGYLGSYIRSECEEILSQRLVSFIYEKGKVDSPIRYEAYCLNRVRCGKFRLKVKAKAVTSLYLIYDDYLIDGKVKFNREQIIHGMKWTLQPGEYDLYSHEVYSAKYITLIIEGNANINDVSMICIENPNTIDFSFQSSDEVLQSIVEAARHTFEQNAYDLFFDCPSRERGGYLCDGYFTAKAESFFCGNNKIEGNLLENYAHYRNEHFRSDGILPMCYPSEPKNEDDYIPNWVLWFVVQIEDWFVRTQQEELADIYKEKIRAIISYFSSKENEFGLLENMEGWVFLEWSKASDFMEDVNFPSNMLYCATLESAAKLLKDNTLTEKANNLKKTIKAWAYNGEWFIDNAVRRNGKLTVTENISETCQYFAMFFNILKKEEAPAFYEKMLMEFGAFRKKGAYADVYPSNLFIGYVLRLMLLACEGKRNLLLEECKRTFADMARSTSTIWELFGDNASCNHGFGSIIGKLICEAETGLVFVNEKERIIVLGEYAGENLSLCLPVQLGVLKIVIRDGKRNISIPNGYSIQFLKGE